MDHNIEEHVEKLKSKYESMGQDLTGYLDGLLLSNYLTYWDYIHLDTLLTLQNPKTDYPDELIFIIYHQITELYFKLSLHELQQIAHNGKRISESGQDLGWKNELSCEYFSERLNRVNKYFEALTKSFEIMIHGMEKEQFLRYRMALLPASGFQSAQYRTIEIYATDVYNLVAHDQRNQFKNSKDRSLEKMFDYIYWNRGATELATGKKTLTLKQFEDKYTSGLLEKAKNLETRNLWQKFKALAPEDQASAELRKQLRQFDVNVNINWPLVHYKSAVRYLQKDESDVAATGGTNWQKYLPPRIQRRIFYPELWSEEELANWGKGFVDSLTESTISKA